jgi:hypothetical protein
MRGITASISRWEKVNLGVESEVTELILSELAGLVELARRVQTANGAIARRGSAERFVLKGHDFSRAANGPKYVVGFSPCKISPRTKVESKLFFRSLFSLNERFLNERTSLRGFYETAGIVKAFVVAFAFVFSLVAFLFLLLLLHLPFVRVFKIHLGLLYALAGSRSGLGA